MRTLTLFQGAGRSFTAECAGILDAPMYFQGTSSTGNAARIAEA